MVGEPPPDKPDARPRLGAEILRLISAMIEVLIFFASLKTFNLQYVTNLIVANQSARQYSSSRTKQVRTGFIHLVKTPRNQPRAALISMPARPRPCTPSWPHPPHGATKLPHATARLPSAHDIRDCATNRSPIETAWLIVGRRLRAHRQTSVLPTRDRSMPAGHIPSASDQPAAVVPKYRRANTQGHGPRSNDTSRPCHAKRGSGKDCSRLW